VGCLRAQVAEQAAHVAQLLQGIQKLDARLAKDGHGSQATLI
jgi:hypothetical protein